MYAGGVAAVAAGRYGPVASLLVSGQWQHPSETMPLILGINTHRVLTTSGQLPHWLYPGGPKYYAPGSKHLEVVTRGHLQDVIPLHLRFEDAFDRFEAILGLVHMHLTAGAVLGGSNPGWAPVGMFAYRNRYMGRALLDDLAAELHGQGEQWGPVAAGLFGSAHRYEMAAQALERYRELVASSPRY
jgi:hypothetical protein